MNSIHLAFAISSYLFMKQYDKYNDKVHVYNAYIHLKFQSNTIFVYTESKLLKIQIFIAFLSLQVNLH